LWARKKGIAVVGTGDFTHPAWRAELQEKLIPAEPGLFRLQPDQERVIASQLPHACQGATRFMLSVEISTIYKKGERTRKIHHLIYVPDFAAADRLIGSLDKIGNLKSDGRPILGLDSRHLLEIVLESGADSYLVPAHIWTPWFAALGSKSGFDAIDDCYADLAPHIFAVETGVSSDPPMNWRVSSLDRFRLVSNSDAHSPEKLGREACVFTTDLDYFSIRQALETGQGYEGTVEFFPEEGKYHLDGHRACGIRLSPQETRAHDGRCPVCGKLVTVGVMHRVETLADRLEETPPVTAGSMKSLVPLSEVLAELAQVGAKSKRVARQYESLLGQLGPELILLNDTPLDDIRNASSSLLAEGIARLREQQVIREAGYDGEYGTIRLFHEDELRQPTLGASWFAKQSPTPLMTASMTRSSEPIQQVSDGQCHDAPQNLSPPASSTSPYQTSSITPSLANQPPTPGMVDLLFALDQDQRQAVTADSGALLIVAGPGSGKTRTLTHRIAYLVSNQGVTPTQCLAITFTRRAANEMRERLHSLLPDVWQQIPIFTFHALGLSILQEHCNAASLQRGFRVATEAERLRLLQNALNTSERQAQRLLSIISHAKRTRTCLEDAKYDQAFKTYKQALEMRNLVDYDDLVNLTADLLTCEPNLRASYQHRYPWVFIDEYQDIDEQQLRLLKQLVSPHGNVCAIGDPDQAIYSFRGADVRFFGQFQDDFPSPKVIRLTRNYRSDRNIVALSSQVLASDNTQHRSDLLLKDGTNLVTLHEAPTDRAEAEFVVQTIEQLIGGHSFFSIDSGRSAQHQGDDISFADIAILYRTEALAPVLIEALRRSGMPFQHRSHHPLTASPHLPALIDTLRQMQPSGSLTERLAAATTLLQHAAAEVSSQEIREAFDLLKPLADTCDDNLERFLAELALHTQMDTWDPRADRLSLLTLHAAKGLEFPVVFIVGCEAGILPLTWGNATNAELDEERRLFYVGVTRAKARLYLCHTQTRLWRGQVRQMALSPYLTDVEGRLLKRQHTQLSSRLTRPQDTQLDLF
jgi:DNA helicase-2/ATP-dependent DNA helicase PcrA